MGIFSKNKAEDLEDTIRGVIKKEFNYADAEPRNQFNGAFSLPAFSFVFDDDLTYAERSKAIYNNSIAKTCVLMRAKAIGNIDIDTNKAGSAVKALLESPNHRDGTLQTFLTNIEHVLSIGGQVPLFWDMRLPLRPMIHAFRPDLVVNDVKNRRYEYRPNGKDAEFVFEYNDLGVTTRALQRIGNGLSVMKGGQSGLQMVSYFDARTSSGSAGAGDTALRAIKIMDAIDLLLGRKFNSGGTKAGFFQLTGSPTDADIERLKAQFNALNITGSGQVLPAGVTFNDAQLTLAEMEVLEARNQMAREICSAFQVPAELVNENEATYANVRGKDKVFYRNFIGPEAHWLVGQLQTGLRLYVDPKASIAVDETSVQHLEEDRLERASQMAQMKAFTADEIRAVMGYKAAKEGTEFVGAQVNQGQPEEKPKGEVAFNADAGKRGDENDQ